MLNKFSKNFSFLKKTVFAFTTVRCKSIPVSRLKTSAEQQSEAIKWILFALPATSFGLGCWQTYRLRWKLDLIETIKQKSSAAPVDLPEDFSELEKMEYLPVKVRGQFLHDKEILIGPRALIESEKTARFGSLISDPKKNQGWLVVTPFKLIDSNEIILVNRGWIPSNMKNKEKRINSLVEGPIELTGVVRLTESRQPMMPKNTPSKGQWLYRDLKQMSQVIGCAPVWIDARGIDDPPEGWPIPNQTRVTLRNEHLSYLITWFSLSGFTAYMWHRYFIRKLPLI